MNAQVQFIVEGGATNKGSGIIGGAVGFSLPEHTYIGSLDIEGVGIDAGLLSMTSFKLSKGTLFRGRIGYEHCVINDNWWASGQFGIGIIHHSADVKTYEQRGFTQCIQIGYKPDNWPMRIYMGTERCKTTLFYTIGLHTMFGY